MLNVVLLNCSFFLIYVVNRSNKEYAYLFLIWYFIWIQSILLQISKVITIWISLINPIPWMIFYLKNLKGLDLHEKYYLFILPAITESREAEQFNLHVSCIVTCIQNDMIRWLRSSSVLDSLWKSHKREKKSANLNF